LILGGTPLIYTALLDPLSLVLNPTSVHLYSKILKWTTLCC